LNLLRLSLQIFVIVGFARLAGRLFPVFRQPRVVGEMVAGILLGPSLLGWLAPALSSSLFPAASLDHLNAVSQLGLMLFMFLVGLRLDTGQLRKLGRLAVVTSNASILVPMTLGVALGARLYPRFAPPSSTRVAFELFMGAAMSVTAFPVLARIIAEKGWTTLRLGVVAIACAAIDDVTAWLMLAGIIGYARAGTIVELFETAALLAAYLVAMQFGLKPLLHRWKLQEASTTLPLLILFASACVTEWIGVHALFGAFFAGTIMPKEGESGKALAAKLEPITNDLLLPLFFALTGLRTSLGLIHGSAGWLICGAIVITAVCGKWGGATLAARWAGMPWSEASALGILMNTRGLVELVILNIRLALGILSPELFSMMVVMALVTTLMTTPLLAILFRPEPGNFSSPAGVL
jgi:Kef-type K+ transport system membrane component KefB